MKVLLVEDEIDMAISISKFLGNRNWQVSIARGIYDTIQLIENEAFDICLLDLLLDDGHGEELLKHLNTKKIPVIVLTFIEDVRQKVKCLKSGADDYITKPFNPEELIARIEAVLRRYKNFENEDILIYKGIYIDLFNMSAKINDVYIQIPRKQLMLLIKLVEHAEKVVTYNTLLSYAWGSYEDACMESLRTHMHKLRKLLRAYNYDILSYPGIGYMLKYINEP